MSQGYRKLNEYHQKILSEKSSTELLDGLKASCAAPQMQVPKSLSNSMESVELIWNSLNLPKGCKEILFDSLTQNEIATYDPNIENFIGTVKIPVGLAGPLRVNGLFAKGDYYIPLATTEAALVASYNRAAQLISEVGGCTAMLLFEGLTRVPVFIFNNLKEAGTFVSWALGEVEKFREIAESTTRHGKLQDMRVSVSGNCVYLIFEYLTGDASGQNMVTISTHAVLKYIESHSPVKPQAAYVESNMSGDKKASSQSFQLVRGKKVTAEVVIPKDLLQMRFSVTPEKLVECYQVSNLGSLLIGTMGAQAQFANALAALYIACGQDPACVAESAVGVTSMKLTAQNDLYVSVTLPNLMVGTVGGGTNLPSQKACLDIMGLSGAGNARAFAEVVAGVVLCGEISLPAAICSGQFARAHDLLARVKKRRPLEEK